MNTRAKQIVAALARVILAGTFLYAGIVKLTDMAQTQLAVTGYRLLPETLIWPAALILPWAEIVAAGTLLLPQTRRAARGLLAVMLAGFLVAIFCAFVRGIDIECGCFGGTGKSNYAWLFARDFGFIALLFLTFEKTEKQ